MKVQFPEKIGPARGNYIICPSNYNKTKTIECDAIFQVYVCLLFHDIAIKKSFLTMVYKCKDRPVK